MKLTRPNSKAILEDIGKLWKCRHSSARDLKVQCEDGTLSVPRCFVLLVCKDMGICEALQDQETCLVLPQLPRKSIESLLEALLCLSGNLASLELKGAMLDCFCFFGWQEWLTPKPSPTTGSYDTVERVVQEIISELPVPISPFPQMSKKGLAPGVDRSVTCTLCNKRCVRLLENIPLFA